MRSHSTTRRLPRMILIAAVLVAIGAYFLSQPRPPAIDEATATDLLGAADQFWARSVAQSLSGDSQTASIPEDDWPPAVKKFSPKSLRLNADGLYLKFGEFFVTECGLFVLPTNSAFVPTDNSDPSYRQLRGRVYWYRIEG